MKTPPRTINIDQLYTQDAFLSFCNDYHSSRYNQKLGVKITTEFLLACEKDRFILPIHIQKEAVIESGKKVTKEIKYYSPFQIFLVAELCNNFIDKDNTLWDVDMSTLEYQQEHNTRFINWGGHSAFNIDNRKTEKNVKSKVLNQFVIMEDFHNLLLFIHTCKTLDKSVDRDHDKRRLYRSSAQIQFDFSDFVDIKKELKRYHLDAKQVKVLIKIIGNFALHIDPMEQWFNYIHKHPTLRKDEFKGMASVAQELYNICDIAKELVEAVEQKELPPLLEFIKLDFAYANRDKLNSYAEGEDILAIKKSHESLTGWIKKNTKYLNALFEKHTNWKKVNFVQVAKELKDKLEDFHRRYGDIRYIGSSRTIKPSNVSLVDLDPDTKKYADFYTKNDTPEEDYPAHDISIHISNAIESRLSDLQREVSSFAHHISNLLENDRPRIESEKHSSTRAIQEKYNKQNEGSNTDQGLLVSLFWREYLPKEQKVFDLELEKIEKLKSELYEIVKETRLVFCAKCREKHVVIHQLRYDEKLSNEAICDDCISTKELETIKSGEWKCEHVNHKNETCGQMLYKFAHNNILSSILKNTANAKVTLNYGQMEIEISCPKCREKSRQVVEWGWLP
jgi:hypothetical protein